MTDGRAYQIPVKDGRVADAIREFFKTLLTAKDADALLLPMATHAKGSIMPALVTDPAQVDAAVVFSPSFPVNTGRMTSRISYKTSGRKTAVFQRPCEHRAFLELAKLKQGARDELLLVGADCCGALTWKDFNTYQTQGAMDEDDYIQHVYSSQSPPFESDVSGFAYSAACRTCEQCVPENTDINLLLFGADLSEGVPVVAASPKGQEVLDAMGLTPCDLPAGRQEKTDKIKDAGRQANLAMVEDVEARTNTFEKLAEFFDRCINCYNCRNMCPVCYCRECVFNTDVFSHDPVQYQQWAQKKGTVKLPTDTLFYHLTRMAHMSHACVGCGQCSNACPSDIPVFELFKSVAGLTQAAFDYLPGHDESRMPPFSEFKEKELEETVGIKK